MIATATPELQLESRKLWKECQELVFIFSAIISDSMKGLPGPYIHKQFSSGPKEKTGWTVKYIITSVKKIKICKTVQAPILLPPEINLHIFTNGAEIKIAQNGIRKR